MDLLGLNIILVRSKTTHVWHKGMKNVIAALKKHGIFPEWKKPDEIVSMSLTNTTVLVMPDFNCDHFKDFSETECLIIGPDCLTECIERKISIPDNGSAVYNLAMADLVITCTNMSKTKKAMIKNYVGWMGGCYTNTFTLAHTHLIADGVNSEKCYVAAEKRKPIMDPEWVTKVWEDSLDDCKLKGDNDDMMAKYRLPPFKGLEITLSNLNSTVKRKYKKLIEDNGGVCCGSLTQKQTHFVVTDKCEGEKVKSALAWGDVYVVSPQWLEMSVEAMGPLPPKEFLLKQRPTCSTPTSELPSFMSAADISAVGGANSTTGSQHIEETLNNTAQSAVSYIPVAKPKPVKPKPQANPAIVPPSPAIPSGPSKSRATYYEKYKLIIEEIKPSDVAKAGSFLDGCKIYLSGWELKDGDKLKRLLVKGGATVLTKATRGVSHIVSADLPSNHAALTSTSGCQKFVSVEWVKASLEEGKPVDSAPYILVDEDQSKPPPPSPLSHKGLELLKSMGKSQENKVSSETGNGSCPPPVSRKLFEKTPKKKLLSNFADSSDSDLGAEKMADLGDPHESHQPLPAASVSQKEKESTTSATLQSTEITNTSVFQGLVFVVLGFDSVNSAEVVKVIESQGGSAVPPSFQGVPDYAVLPIEGVQERFTATEVVNALWIEDCLDQGCLVSIQYYHQTVSIRAPGDPLSSTIICLSGFPPKEKTFLSNLATILGATVQEAFSRKDNPAKGVLRSTHLISNEPSGSKYEAAIKWGVPAISKSWLLEVAKCADQSPPLYQPYLLSRVQPNQDDVETTPLISKSIKSSGLITPGSSSNTSCSQLPKTSQISNLLPKTSSLISNCTTNKEKLAVDSLAADNQDVAVPKLCENFGQDKLSDSTKQTNENITPLSCRSLPNAKDSSRSSSSIFPNPGGDESKKFNTSISSSCNSIGLKRKSRDLSPLKERNSHASPLFVTPQNPHEKIARMTDSGSEDGKSPFHVDTPETPLGRIFYSNPDKKVSKMYKKFIDSFPDFKPETPVVASEKRSPPIHVLRKQILAQLGGDVEGIEKGTGKLLKGGAYAEWANSSTESSFTSEAPGLNTSKTSKDSTPSSARKKSPGSELRKSSNAKVNELRNLMAEIQKSSEGGESQEEVAQGMKERILERLQSVPNQDQNDIKSHPLNKIRPNSENLFDAERPSALSLDKDDRGNRRNEALARIEKAPSQRPNDFTLDDDDDDGTPTQPVPKRLFMLSSLAVANKEKYEGIIQGLGGEVSLSAEFEEASTHLIIETPVRNEKLLCSIASGKWILHTTYLDQCYERRCFIPEESYEWGNPLSESRLPKLDPGSQKEELAKAAYRWRKSCTNLNQRAFRHMKAALICRDQTRAMFKRVLLAGGARIIDDSKKSNICLVEEGKVDLDKSVLESLASKSVPCVPLIYLSNYLVKYPNINPYDFLIEAYIPLFKKK